MVGTSHEKPLGPAPQLPCDGDGVCMKCKSKPPEVETLTCKTCATPWHVNCLAKKPERLSEVEKWECPDCDGEEVVVAAVEERGELVAAIREIEGDERLTEEEKARKRQELMSGKGKGGDVEEREKEKVGDNEIMEILGENIKCSFCMQLPDRPVTTPCGHNFCLKCFEKWTRGQGKTTCAKCRVCIPQAFVLQPRINASLVFAIRAARNHKPVAAAAPRVFHCVRNEDLPDVAFTTERAVKSGKANAKSGRIFVTIPNDHFGPITAEYDPVKNTGVLVGDSWEDRFACRQWGAHFPLVSGIAGQSKYGAQSIVLSGGYEDDEDHGEWFIYTGSGGRDLKTGNKRTSKEQTSNQKFTQGNESLRMSCRKGYPVRVIRSHKERRSNYAPGEGVRYDGVYRIEKCWIKQQAVVKDGVRTKGFNVCRYLFVRCDNSPAPWSSDEHGDRPRPLPVVGELKEAFQITERKEKAHWDFDEEEGCWKWMMPPPPSVKTKGKGTGARSSKSSKAKILKEFSCLICHKVLTLPVTTPCAHNFCKACLDGVFKGQKFERERKTGGRQLRTQKTVLKCPSCPMNISDFLQNAQVNRELMGVIESLMRKLEEEEEEEAAAGVEEESSDIVEADEDQDEDEDEEVNEDAAAEVENSVLDSSETEGKPVKVETKSQDTNDGDKPSPAKRGRKRKNAAAGTAVVTNDGDKPSAPKRGRPRKSAGVAVKTSESDSREVAEDGNDSPSSPLHVSSDHELE